MKGNQEPMLYTTNATVACSAEHQPECRGAVHGSGEIPCHRRRQAARRA